MTKIHLLLAEIQFCKSAVCDVIRCTVIVKNIPTLVLVSASGITPPRGSKTYFLNQISKTTPQDYGIKKGPEMAKILNLYLCDDARNVFNHDHWDCKVFTLKRRRRKKKALLILFSLCFSVYVTLLIDQIYPTQIQQHLWIPLVGLCTRSILYPLIHTHGSTVDVVCLESYSRNTKAGTVTGC